MISLPIVMTFAIAQYEAPAKQPANRPSNPEIRTPKIGIDATVFVPTNKATESTFGNRWFGLGLGFGSVLERTDYKIQPDVSLLRNRRSETQGNVTADNEVLLLSFGIQVRHASKSLLEGGKVRSFNPYYGAGLNGTYGDVKLPFQNVRSRGVRLGGSLFAGATLGANASLELRYRALPSFAGYDFKGVSLSFGYRF